LHVRANANSWLTVYEKVLHQVSLTSQMTVKFVQSAADTYTDSVTDNDETESCDHEMSIHKKEA
jgi:hypothetical protein